MSCVPRGLQPLAPSAPPAEVKIKALSGQPEEGSLLTPLLTVWRAHLSHKGISHLPARRNLIRTPPLARHSSHSEPQQSAMARQSYWHSGPGAAGCPVQPTLKTQSISIRFIFTPPTPPPVNPIPTPPLPSGVSAGAAFCS